MLPQLTFPYYHHRHVHIGMTGSIALYKIIPLVRQLKELGVLLSATLTASAERFVTPLTFRSAGVDHLFGQLFHDADQFAHLQPGREADCQIIAPATANFLAKMAHGLADDMLSCQVLAFRKTQIVAPAMNTNMWLAPVTQHNIELLRARGVVIVPPDDGVLACGDIGSGKLADENLLLLAVLRALTPPDMAGNQVLVSLGPTHEYFDAARYWSNPSTGLMGACLAIAAWLRGAAVTVVHGPVSLWLPRTLATVPVISARDMHQAMTDLAPDFDLIAMTAAVSDFSPVPYAIAAKKFKRDVTGLAVPEIRFTSNPDILAALGAVKTPRQRLIGFCAETHDLEENAKDKLRRKNCDLIVANRIGAPETGFASLTNDVMVLDAKGRYESWPRLAKSEVAWRIWDWANHA